MEKQNFLKRHQFKALNPFNLIRSIYPKLESNRIKGENGKIGILGGSIEYTGAPYYSAISSLKTGADISHVFCHKDAATAIKSYSPEFIVHPSFTDEYDEKYMDKTVRWFKSMTSLVIGPGLGREDPTDKVYKYLVEGANNQKGLFNMNKN